jgi:protein-S-isoprenylcysteine O-methyltransferase Ste14
MEQLRRMARVIEIKCWAPHDIIYSAPRMHQSLYRKRHHLGAVLVALQFGLLLLMATLAAPNVLRGTLPAGVLSLAAASIALAVWTLRHNRIGNFNIRPMPIVWGVLVTTGPYRWIRHPMYTSVLMGAGALVWMSSPLPGWISWVALAVVLFVKSSLEERWMKDEHPGYASYVRESKRFVPWIF